MAKKDKLYKVNKWNMPLFAQGVDREHNNIFDGALSSNINRPLADRLASNEYGSLYGDKGYTMNDYLDSKNWLGLSKRDNLFSKYNIQDTGLKLKNTLTGGNALNALADPIGEALHRSISGGLTSNAGNILKGAGDIMSKVLPGKFGIVGKIGFDVLSGGVNKLIGTKVNQEKLNAANQGTNALNSFKSDADEFADIQGPEAVANVQDAYKGGVFKRHSAKEKNEALKRERANALAFANRSIENNVDNIIEDKVNDALANFASYGGPLDMIGFNNGAIGYDFMSDYLMTKNRVADNKNNVSTNYFSNFSNPFAIGGDLQTQGADWSTGLTHIDAGGTHEENPNEGIQVGVDNEGVPNLVEEGETIFNDYVFSDRIKMDDAAKERFHISKKKDYSFAEYSKKLEKLAGERMDAITRNGLKKQLAILEEEQERQREELKAQEAQEAFAQLPVEQQQALLQQAAMQEQQAVAQENMPTEEQMIAEQQMQEQAVPQEEVMMQEEGELPIEQMAEGGKINRFDNGGRAYKKFLSSLGFNTQKEFDDWTKEKKIDLSKVWTDDNRDLDITSMAKLWANDNFKKALAEKNPALAHAFTEHGYDFGYYQPSVNNTATIQSIEKGNWKATDGKGWKGSDDMAFQQAIEGLSEAEIEALTTEQLAERMRNTEAYKNTSKWLEDKDNALLYLNTLLNNANTPKAAKDYAAKFVKDGKWKNGFNYDYNTVFGKVRGSNPGTYWHSVKEANRGNIAKNYVINDDGTIEEIITDVPEDWTAVDNYTWTDEDNDFNINYYKRPIDESIGTVADGTTNTNSTNGNTNRVAPNLLSTWQRDVGAAGPLVALGMQALGVGKPDNSGLYSALNLATTPPALYQPRYIGNYMKYNPMDILFEQAKLDADSRATDRAILNSAMPQTSKNASLLANSYNNQIASGELYRKALEYNDAQRKAVQEFNRETDLSKVEAYNKAAMANMEARNRANMNNAQMALNVASRVQDNDASWFNGIYGNTDKYFKNLILKGNENESHNMIARMAADGLFGPMRNQYIADGYLTEENMGAKGGKLKKKKSPRKGLTF